MVEILILTALLGNMHDDENEKECVQGHAKVNDHTEDRVNQYKWGINHEIYHG